MQTVSWMYWHWFGLKKKTLGCIDHEADVKSSIVKFYIVTRLHFLIKGINKSKEERRKMVQHLKARSCTWCGVWMMKSFKRRHSSAEMHGLVSYLVVYLFSCMSLPWNFFFFFGFCIYYQNTWHVFWQSSVLQCICLNILSAIDVRFVYFFIVFNTFSMNKHILKCWAQLLATIFLSERVACHTSIFVYSSVERYTQKAGNSCICAAQKFYKARNIKK